MLESDFMYYKIYSLTAILKTNVRFLYKHFD